MSGKRNIKNFGKTYDYLKDPELRRKETNDALLTIDSAEFSGVDFQYLSWRNIRFVNCNFVGAYEVRPKFIENALFEDCKFAGIFNLGKLKQVRFLGCLIDGTSHLAGDTGSKEVVFESCQMMGNDPEPNHWGSFGAYGDVTFIKCKARWISLTGETRHVITDCEFENVDCQVDGEGGGSAVLIENSKLRGTFDMVPASLQSLTIRDTVIDSLDLSGASVKGDILMERVKGGAINIGIREGANSFVLKDSQIYGNGEIICSVYAGAFKTVLIEDCVFGGGPTVRAGIGGGFEPDDKAFQPVLTQSFTLRRNKVPSLRTGRLNAAHVVFEENTIDSLELIQSRIGKLEMQGNTFARSVDFSGTQARQSKVQALAKGQAKLDGSNVKLN